MKNFRKIAGSLPLAWMANVGFHVAIFALMSVSAVAQCSRQWDASGEWEIRQGRTIITLNIKQSGSALSGTATSDGRVGSAGLKGDATGDADGDAFSIGVRWSNGVSNVYRATVSASGKLSGDIFDRNGIKTGEKWNGVQPLTCGWVNGKSRGNLTGRLSANSTASPGQGVGSRLAGPILVATAPFFQPPNSSSGQAILQWDAGGAYPNAEVWVRIGNSPERTLFAKSPKGGSQIPVQRGIVYTYILMNGRNILASTVIVGQ